MAAETQPEGEEGGVRRGGNVMFTDSLCLPLCLPVSPPLCLRLASQQRHHEGRHRQQQHGQHLPSQESCGAAEDGGLHGQNKGTKLLLSASI